MKREIYYSDIESSLSTGDLILFHGKQETSVLIELLEWSYWSHVGMVIIPKDIGLEGDYPLIWESTSSGDGIIDVLINKEKENGPMLIPLKERIKVDLENDYDTHFKVRYFNRKLNESELINLKDFILKVHNDRFPTTTEMLKIYLEGKEKNKKAPDDIYFCSQLVADTLIHMELLSGRYVPNGYCPADFDEGKNLPILKRISFSNGAYINHI